MDRVWCVLWACVALAAWGCGEREAAPGAARPVAPVAQPPAPRVLEHVTNGYTHCRLLEGGDVECWGKNRHGQVGDGTIIEREAPVVVLRDAKLLSMGQLSSCALKRDDTLWCWGKFNFKLWEAPEVERRWFSLSREPERGVWRSPTLITHIAGAERMVQSDEAVYFLRQDGQLDRVSYCTCLYDALQNNFEGFDGVCVNFNIGPEHYISEIKNKGAFYSDGRAWLVLRLVGGEAVLNIEEDLSADFYKVGEACFLGEDYVRCFSWDKETLELDVRGMNAEALFVLQHATRSQRSALCFLSESRDVSCVRSTHITQAPRKIASLEPGERLFKRGKDKLCALRDADQRVRCFDDKHAYRTEDTARLLRGDVSRRVEALRRDVEARTHGPEPEPSSLGEPCWHGSGAASEGASPEAE